MPILSLRRKSPTSRAPILHFKARCMTPQYCKRLSGEPAHAVRIHLVERLQR